MRQLFQTRVSVPALAILTLAISAGGCGGGGGGPFMVFPDTAGAPPGEISGGDAASGDSAAAPDRIGPGGEAQDGVGQADVPAPDVEDPDVTDDQGPVSDCDSDDDCHQLTDDPCTFWLCHETHKACVPVKFPDGDPCDDGDVCTVGDKCHGGACVSGAVVPPPEVWDDPCNDLVCDPETGWHPKPIEGSCDDGHVCNGDEECKDGVCVSLAPPPAGTPCDNGDPCTDGDTCHGEVCMGGDDICTAPTCGDGVCQDDEHCQSCEEDCGTCESSCCQTGLGPGCDNDFCQGIVCDIDEFCCTESWDWNCADWAEEECPVCGGGAKCGDWFCDFGEDCQTCPSDCLGGCGHDCCFVHPEAGCEHENCEDKVCSWDDFCCVGGWDAWCVESALWLCGICK